MNKIDKIFAEYFRNWDRRLPQEATQSHQPGEIKTHGWFIQYQFGTNDNGDFLDFYASNRMTNDRHVRIFESGETESLPAYSDFRIYPANATKKDKEEVRRRDEQYNAEVSEMLKSKGFR